MSLRLPFFLLLFVALLGRAHAQDSLPLPTADLFATLTLPNAAQQSFRFTFPPPRPGTDAVLVLRARLATPRAAGYTPALRLTLNDRVLDGAHLLNRPLRAQTADGRTHSLVAGERFAVFYAPDFTAADRSAYAIAGVRTAEFELRITDLLRDGDNELVLAHAAAPTVKPPLVAADCRIITRAALPLAASRSTAGPPTGELAIFAPATTHRTAYRATPAPDARLTVTVGRDTFDVASEFSTPDGKWFRGSNAHFRHTRRIEQRDESIVIFDTFENLTEANLPLMQRHRAQATGEAQRIWLAGLAPASLNGRAADPQNPSLFVITATAGLGLLPLNDEFQVHVRQDASAGALTLSDPHFVLRPRATYTAEWAIVPTAQPDHFAFVNATRRLLDTNFTLGGMFAFLRAGPLTEKWSDSQFADFIRFKSADLVCASISSPGYQGANSHGTSFQRIPLDSYRRWVERVHRLAPGVQTSIYFHCFLDTVADSPTAFADARLLRPDGTQGDYGKPIYKLFFPTATNTYGRAVARNVDRILDEIRADGVYWDELEYSALPYHYGEPWDGCSADIDARTHTVTRLKSSVALLSQPWRLALAQKILARGPLIANGQPHTRTMAQLKISRFVETGSPSNCAHAQLHSPIALGDHLTERTTADAYRGMVRALDFGCLSHWYSDAQVIPTHPTLAQYLFPSTPVELHAGYLIARERIVTNRSGLFGWGDDARHEVHVFDAEGREQKDFRAPFITRDGQTFSEVRLAAGWSAAILRR